MSQRERGSTRRGKPPARTETGRVSSTRTQARTQKSQEASFDRVHEADRGLPAGTSPSFRRWRTSTSAPTPTACSGERAGTLQHWNAILARVTDAYHQRGEFAPE
jgi:hypothetical protein